MFLGLGVSEDGPGSTAFRRPTVCKRRRLTSPLSIFSVDDDDNDDDDDDDDDDNEDDGRELPARSVLPTIFRNETCCCTILQRNIRGDAIVKRSIKTITTSAICIYAGNEILQSRGRDKASWDEWTRPPCLFASVIPPDMLNCTRGKYGPKGTIRYVHLLLYY